MDGIPPERMVTDSWPALHGRPVLRRTVAVGLVLCVSVGAALVVRGVNALTVGRTGRETDRDRAERLAGLHPSQHPGAGRFYVPVGAVYTHTSDGAPVAYLHYRLGGGKAPGLGDFLSAYDLPSPGAVAPLPADLLAALGGDEPAEAPELPDAPPPPTPTPSATPAPTPTDLPSPDADPDPSDPSDPAPELSPAPEEPTPDDPTPTPTGTPTPPPTTLPTHAPTARRIYVATIPGGLAGAADIYIRATG
ncbi:hypothetical protein [Kitasatospora brasiliensis]|uniref:hypothetical protein n=1 Tax=Kitasatospora brasiliensis TaxID=3058040 RepID=UPI00292FC5D1|nr:hypothetical protein [Kitasatospora sp. K002]